jgi:hypothetical protein
MGLSVSSLEICWDSQYSQPFLERGFAQQSEQRKSTHLHLGIGPTGHLDDHVEDRLLLIGIEGNIVPWRDQLAVLLDEDAVLECVRRSDLAGGVCHVV